MANGIFQLCYVWHVQPVVEAIFGRWQMLFAQTEAVSLANVKNGCRQPEICPSYGHRICSYVYFRWTKRYTLYVQLPCCLAFVSHFCQVWWCLPVYKGVVTTVLCCFRLNFSHNRVWRFSQQICQYSACTQMCKVNTKLDTSYTKLELRNLPTFY